MLALWRASSESTGLDFFPARATREAQPPVLRGGGAASPTPKGESRASTKAVALHVLVLHEGDGTPVTGARVYLVQTSTVEAELGAVLQADVLSSGSTDEEGRVTLLHDADQEHAILWAQADGLRPARVPVRGSDVALRLAAGFRLSGRVARLGGGPVGGIEVRAREIRLPRELGRHPGLIGGSTVHRAQTDESGLFEFNGLANVVHRLEVVGDGWSVWVAPRSQRNRTQEILHLPSSALVNLVVEPIRVVRLRFIDESSGLPLSPSRSSVDFGVFPQRGARAEVMEDWAASSLRGSLKADPTVHVRAIRFGDADAVPESVRMSFDLGPLGAGATELRTLLPSALQTSDWIDEVAIPAKDTANSDSASLVIRERGRSQLGMSPYGRTLLIWNTASGLQELQGRRIDEAGNWMFARVPIGPAELLVADGIGGTSRRQAVEVRPGRNVFEVEYEEKSGALVQIEDAAGRTVFDPRIVNLQDRETGTVRPILPEAVSPSWEWSHQSLAPRVLALPAGSYRLSVFKRGYGWASSDFEVREGEFSRVTVRFRGDEPTLLDDPRTPR